MSWFFVINLLFGVILKTCKGDNGKVFSLVCPKTFEAVAFAYYVMGPNNGPQFPHELSNHSPQFSFCVLCIHGGESFFKVENCIGPKNLRETGVAYSKVRLPENNFFDVGIQIDFPHHNLSSTIESMKLIQDSSMQSKFLKCPKGFKMDKLVARLSLDSQGIARLCFTCYNDEYSYSTCINQERQYYPTVLLPKLNFFGNPCPWRFDLSSSGCMVDLKTYTGNDGRNACGLSLGPKDFFNHVNNNQLPISNVLDFSCENLEAKENQSSSAIIFPECEKQDQASLDSGHQNQTTTESEGLNVQNNNTEGSGKSNNTTTDLAALKSQQGENPNNVLIAVGFLTFCLIITLAILTLAIYRVRKFKAEVEVLRSYISQHRTDENPYYEGDQQF